MATQAEETQAKEFLKRAEIRTMKKDLLALREADSLKERDKIATIKTLEEQLEEKKKLNALSDKNTAENQNPRMEEVLQKNEKEETIAEKDLKNYATEDERQKIFLFESQRFDFEKQIDEIDQKKDPALKLEKNKLLLTKRDWQDKLNKILEQEKKIEEEQKFIAEKAQTTTIASERQGLESRRWDIDKEIQEIEKKRWEAEKQIEAVDKRVGEIDKLSEALVVEKNGLRNKTLGIDKSLREIYSVVMAREEEKRRGNAKDQIAKREALSKERLEEKEKVQRQQWTHPAPATSMHMQKNNLQIPVPTRKTMPAKKSFENEENQRKKFMQDVDQGTQVKGQLQQKSNINSK